MVNSCCTAPGRVAGAELPPTHRMHARKGAIGIAKAFSSVPLGNLDALSYIWHIDTPFHTHTPTIHISVTGMTMTTSGFSNLIFSPGLHANGVTVARSQLYQSDGFAPGAEWYATGVSGPGSMGEPRALSFFVQGNPNAVIHQIALDNGGSVARPAASKPAPII